MKKVDYIIVGDGYAALFFAHQLLLNQRSFVLFSDGGKSASRVSAGIINPVVLKKFTTFWKAQEQLDSLQETFQQMKAYSSKPLLIDAPIHRIFHDQYEKELWLKKADSDELRSFLDPDFVMLPHLKNPLGSGRVKQSARLDVEGFFEIMMTELEKKHSLIKQKFNYSLLNPELKTYNEELSYSKIIFAEGMHVRNNPYFKDIPVVPNKGHHLKINFENQYDNKFTVKKKHFLFPLTSGGYYYGGTYSRDQIEEGIDESAIEQLRNGLKEIYEPSFKIVEENFGFRPTVKDRRPILGHHHDYPELFVFNGLGARGILNGNYFANILYRFIEDGVPLPPEVALSRFHNSP